MSALSIHDDHEFEEIQPHKERTKVMDDRKISQDYLYYRLTKNGDDWSRAFKDVISAPIEQIEKKAREKRGSDGTVLEQMTRMSPLRRGQIENLIQKANDMEVGNTRWEVVYIKAKKMISRKKTKAVEVPEMDIILAKTKKQLKSRQKSNTAEIVDLREPYLPRPKKEKRYVDDNYSRGRKDSGLAMLSDPITNLPLFDRDGRPIDENGPVQFTGLPPQIPRDKPLGAKLEQMKDKDKDKDKGDKKDGKRDKSQKRSRSRDKFAEHGHEHDPDIMVVPEGTFDGDAPLEGIFGEIKEDKRGRRGKSPHGHHDHPDHPEVMFGDAPRSHSRRRRGGHEGELREKSTHRREKSRPRGDSVHFPNRRTQQYFDGSSISSGGSDVSHYGYEYDAESSNTSIGTHGIPRRGSLVRHESRPDVIYKQHRRGPSVPVRHASYSESPRHYQDTYVPRYYDEARFVKPARTPREGYVVYEQRPTEGRYERPRIVRQSTVPVQIPEDRQLLYEAPAQYHQPTRDLVPIQRRYSENAPLIRHDVMPPVLHFPDEDRDVYHRDSLERQSGNIEHYQRDRIREEFLNEKEREMTDRERDLDIREEAVRRMRRESRDLDDRDLREHRRSRIVVDPNTGQRFYLDE
ncbi:uncharacterized protein A1O9_08550 [Exophiala aquamarina CBS 119918]|uniref:Apoptosis regulator Bcl-2 family BH4 domain-containing protein n=1 Tax=Exophiala aquamarina CBS 119918 TaxID=1182545 RepID=A0A072P6T0_9EURO|nr:uncharacterized protein A1O9_08550 [Exophiala aquamarina CBS 119918]KEF55799.1 hypothetical protein A1O9_08550 [Exophiala aquamarina CBS 119918]